MRVKPVQWKRTTQAARVKREIMASVRYRVSVMGWVCVAFLIEHTV